jgi:transposase
MREGTKRSELTALQRQGLERLEACAREGVTIRAYARRRGLSEHKLYQLAKVLRRKGVLPAATRGGQQARVRAERKPRFVEVRAKPVMRESSDASLATWRAQLRNGVVLEGRCDLGHAVALLAKL